MTPATATWFLQLLWNLLPVLKLPRQHFIELPGVACLLCCCCQLNHTTFLLWFLPAGTTTTPDPSVLPGTTGRLRDSRLFWYTTPAWFALDGFSLPTCALVITPYLLTGSYLLDAVLRSPLKTRRCRLIGFYCQHLGGCLFFFWEQLQHIPVAVLPCAPHNTIAAMPFTPRLHADRAAITAGRAVYTADQCPVFHCWLRRFFSRITTLPVLVFGFNCACYYLVRRHPPASR